MAKLSPTKYAIDLLEMNPLHQAAEIMDTRNRYFGKPRRQTQSSFDPEQLQEQRGKAQKLLTKIREEFWGSRLPELDRALQSPVLSQLPDMAAAALKLRKLARLRPQFPLLAQEKWCNRGLFRAFKEIVVLPPKEAGPTKERLLLQIAQSRNLKKCQRSIDKLRHEFPELYELEADWFVMVEQVKPAAMVTSQYQSSSYGGSSGSEFPWWIVWLLIIVLRIFLKLIIRGGG